MSPRFKSLLCTAALLLGALILIVEFQQAEAQCGNFQQSCIKIGIGSDGVVSASCYTVDGSLVGASINLNNYIGNNDGTLVDGVNFSYSCQSLNTYDQVSQFFIAGYCYQVNGAIQLTSYDIGYQVANSNGALIWTYCNSLKVSSSSTGHRANQGS